MFSDQKALASVLKPNRDNKIFSSRLTGRKLLPFEIEIIHAQGSALGLADFMLRHPGEIKEKVINSEKIWNDWILENGLKRIIAISENETTPSDTSRVKRLPRAPHLKADKKLQKDIQLFKTKKGQIFLVYQRLGAKCSIPLVLINKITCTWTND